MTRFVTRGDVRLWCDDSGGDGPPMVLLPGATLPSDSFPSAFTDQCTAAGSRLIRIDPRDTGRSTRVAPDLEYSLSDMAEDVVAVLDACGIGAADLVTFSLGGAVATLLAVGHPARVRSLALIASLSPDMSHGVGPGATDPGYFGGPDDVVGALIRNMGRRTPDDERWLRAEVARWTARAGRWSLAPTMAHMGAALRTTPPSRHQLEKLGMPVLVVHGSDDDEVPVAHAHTLHEWLPNATLQLVEGLGHVPTEPQWRDLAGRVVHFIADQPPGAV